MLTADALAGLRRPGQTGIILYTSRKPLLKDLKSDAVCEVSGMENNTAVELLLGEARLKLASVQDTWLARDIVSALGSQVLVVDQARAYIAHGKCRIHNFLETLWP